MVTKLLTFKTRKQQSAAKKNGRIDGYFAKVAKGRPSAIKMGVDLPMNQTAKVIMGNAKKKKGGGENTYANWSLPGNFAALKAAVLIDIARRKEKELSDDITGISNDSTIPRSTLSRHTKRFQDFAKEKQLPVEHLTRDMIFPNSRGGGNGLLHENDVELLSSTIVYRDEANNGMTRNEAITLVMELSQITDRKAAENHYDYLVRMKRLKGVKNFGRTVKAQATTTKRGQIMVKQQLR